MKEAVLIKSFSNGIALHLDAEMSLRIYYRKLHINFPRQEPFSERHPWHFP